MMVCPFDAIHVAPVQFDGRTKHAATKCDLCVERANGLARIEAPRGEVLYYVASNGTDIPQRVRVRTPSFMNIPTVRVMLQNAMLADVPLIQASIDPCFSCTDR